MAKRGPCVRVGEDFKVRGGAGDLAHAESDVGRQLSRFAQSLGELLGVGERRVVRHEARCCSRGGRTMGMGPKSYHG